MELMEVCPLPRKKFEFLPENGGFWCILGILFTFMQKLVRAMGGAAAPHWPDQFDPGTDPSPSTVRPPL